MAETVAGSQDFTSEMLDVAEKLLSKLGVRRMSRQYSNRDVLYEVIHAALTIGGKAEFFSEAASLTKSEEEWSQFFKGCKVIVRDPEVGRQLLQKGLDSAKAFAVLIESLVKDKAVVVPLEAYPGVSLFKGRQGKSKTSEDKLGLGPVETL